LPVLRAYQLSLNTPPPREGSFDPAAAERGKQLFDATARCATCHIPSLAFTDVNLGILHEPSETGMDPVRAMRLKNHKYRTTPLRALGQHPPYFHDGSAATLLDVVEHYDRFFGVGLSPQEKKDLVEYLKSLCRTFDKEVLYAPQHVWSLHRTHARHCRRRLFRPWCAHPAPSRACGCVVSTSPKPGGRRRFRVHGRLAPGTTVQFFYHKPFFCRTPVEDGNPVGSSTDCELGSDGTADPRPGNIPTLFVMTPIGFRPAEATLQCPIVGHCINHPSTIDLSRVFGAGTENAPLPAHSHIVDQAEGNWWELDVVGVKDRATWDQIVAGKSLATVRAL